MTSRRFSGRLATALTLTLAAVACLSASCTSGKSGRGKKGGNNVGNGTSTSTGTGENPEDPAAGNWQHTVLIIDDGFDSTNDVFKGKIVASFTLDCDESAGGTTTGSGTFDEVKAEVIAEYAKNESSCVVENGVDFTLDPKFKTIESQRDKWNAGLKSKDGIDLPEDEIEGVLDILSGDYHGTNTAGLLAYNNPNIKLVLVQMKLGEAGDSPLGLAGECPKQSDIDFWVQLHNDADVKKAFVEAPMSATDEKLDKIATDNKVSLVNLSLGSSPLPVLEKELKEAGCGDLDFSAQFELDGELRAARADYRAAHNTAGAAKLLTVQAAGNDGIPIDSTATAYDCSDREHDLILVGALTQENERAEFSNFGKCVDYYVLGQSVVVAAPDNFLTISDGTSFSSPLLVRYISRQFDPKTSPKDIVKALDAAADDKGFLPSKTAPEELSFDNKSDAISTYTLTQAKVAPRPNHLRHWRRGMDFGYHRPVRPRTSPH